MRSTFHYSASINHNLQPNICQLFQLIIQRNDGVVKVKYSTVHYETIFPRNKTRHIRKIMYIYIYKYIVVCNHLIHSYSSVAILSRTIFELFVIRLYRVRIVHCCISIVYFLIVKYLFVNFSFFIRFIPMIIEL